MEEQIYEMENIQLEMVDELKALEATVESLEAKNEQLIAANEELVKG